MNIIPITSDEAMRFTEASHSVFRAMAEAFSALNNGNRLRKRFSVAALIAITDPYSDTDGKYWSAKHTWVHMFDNLGVSHGYRSDLSLAQKDALQVFRDTILANKNYTLDVRDASLSLLDVIYS